MWELSLAAASTSVPVCWVSLQWGLDFFFCRPPFWNATRSVVSSLMKGSHNRPWKSLLFWSVNSKHLGSLSLHSDRNLFPLLYPAGNWDNFPPGPVLLPALLDRLFNSSVLKAVYPDAVENNLEINLIFPEVYMLVFNFLFLPLHDILR